MKLINMDCIESFVYKSCCLLFIFCLVSACNQDFGALNEDPNNPTTEVSPEYILPAAIESAVDRYWGHMDRYERLNLDAGVSWVQYFGRRNFPEEGDNYNVFSDMSSNNWESFYNNSLNDFERIRKLSSEDGNYENPNYEGIALTMRSWIFSILTDVYGPIPYSEALRGFEDDPINSPAYNSQEEIYEALLNDLATANELLDPEGLEISGDIMFDGDILRWKKFANSLRLKLANRQAEQKPDESRAIMQEILDDPQTYPIFTGNDDYAQLTHSSVRPSNNPWHEIVTQQARSSWRVSETMIERLKDRDDPRLTAYADTVGEGEYQGIPNGLPESLALEYSSITSWPHEDFFEANAPSNLMTYAELQFVLAEAAFDGDINGDAQAYFEEGITASMTQHEVDIPEDYSDNIGEVTKEKLMMQKWIALYGQGIEAWTEYRRTGMPEVIHHPDAEYENEGIVPTRLEFPSSEYSLNESNVESAVNDYLDGPDNMRTRLWWTEADFD